jgi:hypothetical protein
MIDSPWECATTTLIHRRVRALQVQLDRSENNVKGYNMDITKQIAQCHLLEIEALESASRSQISVSNKF